jgi:hypothetical protein
LFIRLRRTPTSAAVAGRIAALAPFVLAGGAAAGVALPPEVLSTDGGRVVPKKRSKIRQKKIAIAVSVA